MADPLEMNTGPTNTGRYELNAFRPSGQGGPEIRTGEPLTMSFTIGATHGDGAPATITAVEPVPAEGGTHYQVDWQTNAGEIGAFLIKEEARGFGFDDNFAFIDEPFGVETSTIVIGADGDVFIQSTGSIGGPPGVTIEGVFVTIDVNGVVLPPEPRPPCPTSDCPKPPSGCLKDSDCDDGVECTKGTCDTATGECRQILRDVFCPDDGNACTDELCSPEHRDADGNGCISFPRSRACNDGDPCTTLVSTELARGSRSSAPMTEIPARTTCAFRAPRVPTSSVATTCRPRKTPHATTVTPAPRTTLVPGEFAWVAG